MALRSCSAVDLEKAFDYLQRAEKALCEAYERPHQPPLVVGAVEFIRQSIGCLNCANELEALANHLLEGNEGVAPPYREVISKSIDSIRSASKLIEARFAESDENFLYWSLESEQRPPGRTW